MDEMLKRDARVLLAFWLACGLAVTGGVGPLLLAAGGPNRFAGAVIPFVVAAGAMAANALLYQRGRPLATALYFLAGVTIVYALLLMFSVPLRLAVTGTCPEPPAVCPVGLERSFSSGEATGFTIAVMAGVLSIVSGFFGLVMIYRSRPKHQVATPMTRVIPPVVEKAAAPPDTAAKTSSPSAADPSASEPSAAPPD
jgi:hypothetical protein